VATGWNAQPAEPAGGRTVSQFGISVDAPTPNHLGFGGLKNKVRPATPLLSTHGLFDYGAQGSTGFGPPLNAVAIR